MMRLFGKIDMRKCFLTLCQESILNVINTKGIAKNQKEHFQSLHHKIHHKLSSQKSLIEDKIKQDVQQAKQIGIQQSFQSKNIEIQSQQPSKRRKKSNRNTKEENFNVFKHQKREIVNKQSDHNEATNVSNEVTQYANVSLIQIEKVLYELGKQIMYSLNSKTSTQVKEKAILDIVVRHNRKVLQNNSILSALQVLNYVEFMKGVCMTRFERIQYIQIIYKQLEKFIAIKRNRKMINKYLVDLWRNDVPKQVKIRFVSLLQYMGDPDKAVYLREIIPLVKHFKSTEMLILLYEKWKYDYDYSYELIEEIFTNQYYLNVTDISQAYIKLLFMQSIKERYSSNQEIKFSKCLSVLSKSSFFTHAQIDKLIKMIRYDMQYFQTHTLKMLIENNMKNLITVAKEQKSLQNNFVFQHLLQIYLTFALRNSGQILLQQIIKLSKTAEFQITRQNLILYKQLLLKLLKNAEPKLSYQRDVSYKVYTTTTLKFLNEFLPIYIAGWPQVIFQLSHITDDLLVEDSKLIHQIGNACSQYFKLRKQNKEKLTLNDIQFTCKVLKFINSFKGMLGFNIYQQVECLLTEFSLSRQQPPTTQQLQVLYLVLNLLERNQNKTVCRQKITSINTHLIQRQISKLIKEPEGYLKSYDRNLIWLALCSAKVKSQGIIIDDLLLQNFMNEKMIYMINSLQYQQVYDILFFAVGMSQVRPEIYQRLLYNLSTFIVYIKDTYYLNSKYGQYYPKICRLVFDNKSKFKNISKKDSYRVFQTIVYQQRSKLQNVDILNLLDLIQLPSFLSQSMIKFIKDRQFSDDELKPYHPFLRPFQYYNRTLQTHYEGHCNEVEIKSKLREENLSRQQIIEYFQNNEVYRTIIFDGSLNLNFQIPEPKTNISDYKLMYITQRVYQRIRMFNDFNFPQSLRYTPGSSIQVKLVDLTLQKEFIKRQCLVSQDTLHPFSLSKRPLQSHLKQQVWQKNEFVSKKQWKINPKDLYFNNTKLTEQILSKIVKGISGSYEKIRQVMNKFNCNQQLIRQIRLLKIQFQQHGAAIQFKTKSDKFAIISTKSTNYKILYICAYLMASHGYKVAIITEDNDIKKVAYFIKSHFSSKEHIEIVQDEQGLPYLNQQ